MQRAPRANQDLALRIKLPKRFGGNFRRRGTSGDAVWYETYKVTLTCYIFLKMRSHKGEFLPMKVSHIFPLQKRTILSYLNVH